MSFQAYLDNIEEKAGLTPRQFIDQPEEKGYDDPSIKADVIVEWLKNDYDLGRGHAMALVHVIENGAKIDAKHVGVDRNPPRRVRHALARWEGQQTQESS